MLVESCGASYASSFMRVVGVAWRLPRHVLPASCASSRTAPDPHCCVVRAEEEESCEESGIGDARQLSSASSGAWRLLRVCWTVGRIQTIAIAEEECFGGGSITPSRRRRLVLATRQDHLSSSASAPNPVVPLGDLTNFKITTNNYQADALSFFPSVQVAGISSCAGTLISELFDSIMASCF